MSKLRRSKLTLDFLYQSKKVHWISASWLQSSVNWMRLEQDNLTLNHSLKDSMLLDFSKRKSIINACRNSTAKLEMDWFTMVISSKMSGKIINNLWFIFAFLEEFVLFEKIYFVVLKSLSIKRVPLNDRRI